MKRPALIPNWRRAWRMASMQAMFAATALQMAWEANPEAIKAVVPAQWVPWITIGMLVFGMVGRLLHQPKVQP